MCADQDRCPRCHAPNQCGLAAGGGTCWCFQERAAAGAAEVSAGRASAGSERAGAAAGQACLCRRCLTMPGRDTRLLSWAAGASTVTLGLDEAGAGRSLVLLPALSSISTRSEMTGLLERFAPRFLVRSADWPGFGERPRPRVDWSPSLLSQYLRWLLGEVLRPPHAVLAAGHAAGYALQLCQDHPGLVRRLVLVAPTWRGPLPTMMGGQRPWFARVRAALDHPWTGPALYRLNVSRPVIGRMAREHVYEQPGFLAGARLGAKLAVTRGRGARHASVRFVSGALDAVQSRAQFLALAQTAGVPILQIYGAQTPRRSRAEMEALAQLPQIATVCLPGGRLAVHEEYPDAVMAAASPFLEQD